MGARARRPDVALSSHTSRLAAERARPAAGLPAHSQFDSAVPVSFQQLNHGSAVLCLKAQLRRIPHGDKVYLDARDA